jgi:hypothetical protein
MADILYCICNIVPCATTAGPSDPTRSWVGMMAITGELEMLRFFDVTQSRFDTLPVDMRSVATYVCGLKTRLRFERNHCACC